MQKIIHEKKQAEPQLPIIQLNVGKPLRPKQAKLTTEKRKQFLQLMLQHYNIGKCAAMIGVSYEAITQLRDRDENFARSLAEVKKAWTQNLVEVSLNVASIPTREGAPDRKLQLEALMPETYGRKLDVNVKATVTHENAVPRIADILDRFGYAEVLESDSKRISGPEQDKPKEKGR